MTNLTLQKTARAIAFGKAVTPFAIVPAALMATAAFGADEPPAALADEGIENVVTATGTYATAGDVTNQAYEQVPVEAGAPDLSVVKSFASLDIGNGVTDMADGGDTITYTYVVKNDGNVTLTGVTPVETGTDNSGPPPVANGMTFAGTAGTGSFAAYTAVGGAALTAADQTLAPGESFTFEAIYTMSAVDALLAAGITDAVDNQATSSATQPDSSAYNDLDASIAETTLPAVPRLDIVKTSALAETNGNTTDGAAAVGDQITYTYTIENTGNVAITNIGIVDSHEGTNIASALFTGDAIASEGPLAPTITSDIGTADDGVIATLQAGSTATVTYVHTVTQAEVDAG